MIDTGTLILAVTLIIVTIDNMRLFSGNSRREKEYRALLLEQRQLFLAMVQQRDETMALANDLLRQRDALLADLDREGQG